MTPEEAEAVLALDLEIEVAAKLAVDESAFREDWRARYAAERIVERVFQAAQALPESLRGRYFAGDGFRALRGMRNRRAHNYLDVDEDILWESLAVELPEVGSRLADDADQADEHSTHSPPTRRLTPRLGAARIWALLDPERERPAVPLQAYAGGEGVQGRVSVRSS